MIRDCGNEKTDLNIKMAELQEERGSNRIPSSTMQKTDPSVISGEDQEKSSGHIGIIKMFTFFLILLEKSEFRSKKRRRGKISADKRNYLCNFCQNSYLSYPALYTHKRNKHNIIPITGKQELFKNSGGKSSNQTKFKYSALENSNYDFSELLDYIIINYTKCLVEFFQDPNSVLFNKDFVTLSHEGLKILKSIKSKALQKIVIPDLKLKPCIDDILIVYLVNFAKVTREENLVALVIRFSILLREYLNVVGWDYKKLFSEFNVKVDFNMKGSFTMHNESQEIPDLINEFISVFIELDENYFKFDFKKLVDLSQNFCNWLFVNNLTNFKIATNEIE